MTGPADYLLRVVVAGLDAYEDFIRNRVHPIGGIASNPFRVSFMGR